MQRVIFVIILCFAMGCLQDNNPEILKESKNLLLRNESDLSEIIGIYERYIEMSELNSKEDNEFVLYKRINIILKDIEKQITNNDNSIEEFKLLFSDTLLVKVLNTFYDYNMKINIIEVADTAIMRLQKRIELLKVKRDIYRTIYGRIVGCASMADPSVYIIKDSAKTQIFFGILDTLSNLKDKIEVTSVSLNGKKINIPFKIEDKSFYQEITFFPKAEGKYEWKGNYKILLPTGNLDKIPFNGEFKVDNLSEQLKE